MITEYTIELRMEKSIQRITQPICVRINENETQQIRAKLTYENSPYSVQCDSAELHLLRDDGTWSHLEASVSGTSVTCTIKANQLGKHAQNACAYFFFKQGAQTETTESFQVRVERAATDTEASDAFFDASMNRIATKWGAYEATAEAQESARQSTESKRVTAEQERAGAEQKRANAEQARLNAESARQSAENERKQAEQSRAQAEQSRTTVEQQRVQAESNRANAESNRANAEQQRTQAEQERKQAETTRQSNESTRTSAEQSRQSRFNEMLDAAQNVKFRILSSNEVDSEGKPTITGSVGIIYLVKAQSSEETKANHYTEWIYLENRWELFGSTAPTADPIEVDDIEKLAQGTTIAGNRVLNATGLNALWSKLQARLQAVSNDVQAAQSTAKQADTTAKEVKNNMDWLVLRQKGDSSNLEEHRVAIATLKDKMASVERKINDVVENARKSRAVTLRVRSISEDVNNGLWCNFSFTNTNGFVDFNGYINTKLVSASIKSKPKDSFGQTFFVLNDDNLNGPCSLFQPQAKDYSLSLDWQSIDNDFSIKGNLGVLFSMLYLTFSGDESIYSKPNLGSIYTHVTYPQFIPHANNRFDGFPQFIDKINQTLKEDGLIASYELY